MQEDVWPLQAVQEGEMQIQTGGDDLCRRNLSSWDLRPGRGSDTAGLPQRDLRRSWTVRTELRDDVRGQDRYLRPDI